MISEDLKIKSDDILFLNEKVAACLRASNLVYPDKNRAETQIRKEIGVIKNCDFEELKTQARDKVFRYRIIDKIGTNNITELFVYPNIYEVEKKKWIISHLILDYIKREGIKGIKTIFPIGNTKVKCNTLKIYILRKEYEKNILNILSNNNSEYCEYWRSWFFYGFNTEGEFVEKKSAWMIPLLLYSSKRSYNQLPEHTQQINIKEILYHVFSGHYNIS